MRKLISLLLAVLLVLGTPMTAMAITADTSYGDATIYDTTADYYDTNGAQHNNAEHDGIVEIMHGSGSENGTVSVEMDGKAEDSYGGETDTPATEPVIIKGDVNGGVVASGGANVIIEGNVSGKDGETNGGDGIQASGSTVKVTGNVTGGSATADKGQASGGDGVYADKDSEVEVGGNVTGGSATADEDNASGGDGVYADEGSKVEVGGSVTGGSATGDTYAWGGDGVDADEGSMVEVGGNVTGGSAERDSATTDNGYAFGGYGVSASEGSKVEVNGSTTGGNATGDTDAWGGAGVNAYEGSEVEVGGSTTGGDAEGNNAFGGDGVEADDSTVNVGVGEAGGNVTGGSAEGSSARGGAGVYAFEGSEVEVNGSTTGGSADGDYAFGGNGITMQGDSVIQVAGDAVGGSTTGGASKSEDGFGANIYVKPAAPGSLTVKGEVSGGSDSADIYVDVWPNPGDDQVDPGTEHVPDISVGNYDSIEFNDDFSDYFTEEEARQIVGSIKVTNRPSSSPSSSDDVTVKRSSGTARNGYYMGCLWRNGYITRTLFKVENGAGMKPIWEEAIENGTLTITCENEPVILTTWLEGLKQHQKLGIERIVVKTENCETELVIADLIAMNGTEYVLTQKGDTATLTVDGKEAEIG